MTLERLRYFVSVAQCLNFTRAAAECHIAQTAMSRQIAALEAEVGCRLLDRDRRSVRLTPAGQTFYEGVVLLLDQYQGALERTRSASKGMEGSLRLGIGQYERSFVSQLVQEFHQHYPHIEVSVSQYSYQALVQQLLRGTVDVIFALPISAEYLAGRGVELLKLFTAQLDVAVGREHPFAGLPEFPIDRLEGERVITLSEDDGPCSIEQFYTQSCMYGLHPGQVQRANSLEALLLMVEAGMGVAFMPHFLKPLLPERVVLLPQSSYPPGKFVAAWRKGDPNPATAVFTGGIHNSQTLWEKLEYEQAHGL